MKWIHTVRSYLKLPFYDTCSISSNVRIFFLVSLFVAGFLWFFEPFGIDSYPGSKILLALAFGMVTFVTGMLVEIIQLRVLKINKEHPSWTFGKWLISTIVLILSISIGNYLLINYLSGLENWSFQVFGRFVVNTLAVGIFPIALIGIWSLTRHKRRFSAVASGLGTWQHHTVDTSQLTLPSRTGEDLFLQASNILFLEAIQNYVAVFHLHEGKIHREVIRNTLKEVSGILPHESFFQSHRSFIVNLDHVDHVSGNSQGLVLLLQGELRVPVSRSFITSFRDRWS